MKTTEELIAKIQRLSSRQQFNRNFSGFIKRVRFPFFKNMEPDAEIKFDFPLTVFIGTNGCGKSSALQGLYGCPEGYSVGSYWFNTATDPIPEKRGDLRPSLWYEYYHQEAGRDVQILKYRIQYKKTQKDGSTIVNPDYWEPARPGEKYGMETLQEIPKGQLPPGRLSTRWEGLKKECRYLDFRAQLSAFDKYFYFAEDPNVNRYKTKQDFLRFQSWALSQCFRNPGYIHESYGIKRNEPHIELTQPEIEIVCNILGKKYQSARILRHSLYSHKGGGSKGVSIRFDSGIPGDATGLTYTEAFAGSGEMSVVVLVHEIFNAPPNSLILLDEPEVSLHPGAQKRVLRFLLDQIVEKRHQIILCTHSPSLIEGLPESAIKLFRQKPDGHFKVHSNILPCEAFSQIGQTISDKKKIIVEDEAAKQLIQHIIAAMEGMSGTFDVEFHPGGAKDLFKESLVLSRIGVANTFFILDGDQNRGTIADISSIPDTDLLRILKEKTGVEFRESDFLADSGAQGDDQRLAEMRKFLKYLSDCFRYLPRDNPEDSIILASQLSSKPTWSGPDSGINGKEAILQWVKEELESPTASEISTYRRRLLGRFDIQHQDIQAIAAIIRTFAER